jgi:hypothetical protein
MAAVRRSDTDCFEHIQRGPVLLFNLNGKRRVLVVGWIEGNRCMRPDDYGKLILNFLC